MSTGLASGGDWPRYRGPNGTGVSDETGIPVEWSDTQNLRWKAELPGPGSSSPIVVGDRVFVTCYSGTQGGELQRFLLSFQLADGAPLWRATIEPQHPEDEYRGFLTEHGYASSTPVADGERVFVFCGKAGVLAFDWNGKELWRADVGSESSRQRWGSGASLLLWQDLVIVNAAEESRSIRALDRATGAERWKSEADLLALCYATPALVTLPDGAVELVVPVSEEVWGLRPDTGKLKWYCTSPLAGTLVPSPVVSGDTVIVFGGNRGAGSLAVRAGGEKDVTKSHAVWSGRNSSYVATPVLHDGRLYWVDDRGTAQCVDAATGQSVYRQRLPIEGKRDRPVYASPVLAEGRLYIVTRGNGTYVLSTGPVLEIVARNRFASDDSDFNGTPAISGRRLVLRSDKALYCVAGSGG
jgi:outer membrane protein assembly factor BamB